MEQKEEEGRESIREHKRGLTVRTLPDDQCSTSQPQVSIVTEDEATS